GPPFVVALLALNVAMLVVGLVLGVAVPTVLMVLSLFFGPALRRAAHNTRLAGRQARASMQRAQSLLIHGPPVESEGQEVRVETEAPRARVDSEPPGPQVRRRVVVPDQDDVIDTTGTDASEDQRRRE